MKKFSVCSLVLLLIFFMCFMLISPVCFVRGTLSVASSFSFNNCQFGAGIDGIFSSVSGFTAKGNSFQVSAAGYLTRLDLALYDKAGTVNANVMVNVYNATGNVRDGVPGTLVATSSNMINNDQFGVYNTANILSNVKSFDFNGTCWLSLNTWYVFVVYVVNATTIDNTNNVGVYDLNSGSIFGGDLMQRNDNAWSDVGSGLTIGHVMYVSSQLGGESSTSNPYGFSLFVSGDDYGAGTYVEPAAVGVVDGSNGLNYSRIVNLRQTNYDVYAVIGHIQTYMSDAGPALGSGNYTIFATARTSWVENVHQWFDNWFAGGCQDNLYQQLLKDANGFDGGYGSVSGGAFNVPVGAFWSNAALLNEAVYQGITVRIGFVNGTYGYYSYLLSYTKTGAPIYGESPLPTTLPTSVPYPSGTPMITANPSVTPGQSMNDLFDSVPLMIQILVIFLLIFVPPLLVVANAPHLGMAGYFVGMALMVGIGLYVGIIPMWFLVLIGMALVVIVYGMLQRS